MHNNQETMEDFYTSVMDLLITNAINIVIENHIKKKIPSYLADYCTKIYKHELSLFFTPYDIGENEKSYQKFWSADSEPSLPEVDCLAKNFIKVIQTDSLPMGSDSALRNHQYQTDDEKQSALNSKAVSTDNFSQNELGKNSKPKKSKLKDFKIDALQNPAPRNTQFLKKKDQNLLLATNDQNSASKLAKKKKLKLQKFLKYEPPEECDFDRNIVVQKINEASIVRHDIEILPANILEKHDQFRKQKTQQSKIASASIKKIRASYKIQSENPITSQTTHTLKKDKNTKTTWDMFGNEIPIKNFRDETYLVNNFIELIAFRKNTKHVLPAYASGKIKRC